ncbi:MAG: hypothetical protein KIS30_09185 [Thermoplasmata archaeon]|nr:hypothetical protein [Candidatus Sysuiplasma acidicola]MBX8646912.1 hypothetical protein [Candidatus Sysuiplasma acidicola]MDH2904815.1 hypothetical protein [Methanomassiliicoccales archaeon]
MRRAIIIDRHESFKAAEVHRVLKSGGVFITQQVGSGLKSELNDFLGAKVPVTNWNLSVAKEQLNEAGFTIVEEGQATPRAIFRDIGAVVGYLRIAEWQIDDFDVTTYAEKLRHLDSHIRKNGSFVTRNHLFVLKAVKE